MTKHSWSFYGNVQAENDFKQKHLEVKTWMHEFKNQKEREEIIERLQLGLKFDMRYRALFQFYGKDLVDYKRKHLSSTQVNEFLKVFSNYLTTHLEDNCPPSWKDCQPSFWEEFIYAIIPHHMILSTKQNQSEIFLTQLKKFVRWLDQRSGCSWSKVVQKYAEESFTELNNCEKLLNALYLHTYPNLHHKKFDPVADSSKLDEQLQKYSDAHNSIFEVKKIFDEIITVIDINSKQTYQILNFPVKKLAPGILLDGVVAKNNDDFYWTWDFTMGVYPQKARKYIHFID